MKNNPEKTLCCEACGYKAKESEFDHFCPCIAVIAEVILALIFVLAGLIYAAFKVASGG